MTQHSPHGNQLRLTPALDVGDREFLAGFSPQPGAVARIWPGQPAVPSPWAPCERGCCLVLVPTRSAAEGAGQWLRFIVGEFLEDRHRLDGRVEVPGIRGRGSTLVIVEAGEVFEGEVDLGDDTAVRQILAGRSAP